jgi:hypothetical protein
MRSCTICGKPFGDTASFDFCSITGDESLERFIGRRHRLASVHTNTTHVRRKTLPRISLLFEMATEQSHSVGEKLFYAFSGDVHCLRNFGVRHLAEPAKLDCKTRSAR